MRLTTKDYVTLAEQVIRGDVPDTGTLETLAGTREEDVFKLAAGADMIREAFFNRQIHLCTICNGKSGRCSEDCTFCSQSRFAQTDIDVYPLLPKERLQKGAMNAHTSPVNRYAVVTSGKRLPREEVRKIAGAVAELDTDRLSYCVSLGILEAADFEILKQAGVSRYHHNLETSRSHFDRICTTHSFQERVDTVKAAQRAGMSVCSGGLFGIGESMAQVLELALELRDLNVDAVPVNFLTPIKGTRLQAENHLTPLRCLKIIALFRYVLPQKEILVCGGREYNLKQVHPMIFYAGASGMMTGSYLTTTGIRPEEDFDMIRRLGFETRP